MDLIEDKTRDKVFKIIRRLNVDDSIINTFYNQVYKKLGMKGLNIHLLFVAYCIFDHGNLSHKWGKACSKYKHPQDRIDYFLEHAKDGIKAYLDNKEEYYTATIKSKTTYSVEAFCAEVCFYMAYVCQAHLIKGVKSKQHGRMKDEELDLEAKFNDMFSDHEKLY